MTTNSFPSIDPANEGTLAGTFRHVLKKTMQGMNCALPARVIAYDRQSNRASLQPQVSMLSQENIAVSRASIASAPVVQMGAGGFVLSYNLKPGDLGWIVASDRDISLFLSGYKEQRPNTERMHDFSDAFFIPDPMTGYNIDSEDEENAVLQNSDGTVKISLSSDSIKIKSSVAINIESEDIFLKGNVHIEGDVGIIGNVDIQGDIDSQGTSNFDGDVNVSGREIVQGIIASNDDVTATNNILPGTPPPP